MRRTERVEPRGTLDTELRLERPRRVVQARVDDPAVVRTCFHSGPVPAFEEADRASGRRKLRGGRESRYPRADDHRIERHLPIVGERRPA